MRVVITGAAGNLGTKLYRHLVERGGLEIVRLDRRPGDGIVKADVSLYEPSWTEPVHDAEVVVHLAANVDPLADWNALQRDVDATLNVLTAGAEGGTRVVFASSVKVMEGYRNETQTLTTDLPPLPTTDYAVTKLVGERMARHYGERHHLPTICLRLGAISPGPNPPPRNGSLWWQRAWLGNQDYCQIMERAILAEDVGFAILNAVSDNAGMRWDLTETRRLLGYEPRQSSLPVTPPLRNRMGGYLRGPIRMLGDRLQRLGRTKARP
ncbi:MAG TPA: NAD(P)-dependent oxidoreductase [Gemmatimonadota bacterium]|nr:NAD(P)-dependent oxidoreductase [Gemmatimonadota bacterium]